MEKANGKDHEYLPSFIGFAEDKPKRGTSTMTEKIVNAADSQVQVSKSTLLLLPIITVVVTSAIWFFNTGQSVQAKVSEIDALKERVAKLESKIDAQSDKIDGKLKDVTDKIDNLSDKLLTLNGYLIKAGEVQSKQ